jgi:hypothetical protein
MKLELSPAEAAIIGVMRSGEPFALMVMETDGQFMVTIQRPPLGEQGAASMVGIGPTLDEAWKGRQILQTAMPAVAS